MKKIFKIVLSIILTLFMINFIINFNVNNTGIINLFFYAVILAPKVFLITNLIILLLFLLFYVIWNDIRKSTIILTGSLTIISLLNQIKIFFTNEPVILSDVFLLRMIGDLTNIATNSKGSWILLVLLNIFLIYIFTFLLNYYLKENKYLKELKFKSIILRICIGLFSIIFLVLLFKPSYNMTNSLLNDIYNKDKRIDYNMDSCANIQYFYKHGLIGNIYGKYLESLEFESEDYDEKIVKQELEKYNAVEINDVYGKPNVIMVLGESFWDISKVEEIEFNKDLLENFYRFKEEGTHINLLSCSYGGLTANPEFQIITGGSLKYYGEGTVPYLYKYNSKTNKFPSIIKELNNNDYYTVYLSPTGSNFYNRETVYSSMGIDKLIFEDDLINNQLIGGNVSNKTVVDNIIKVLADNKEKQIFMMALTEETHMPYDYSKYSKYDIDIINENFTQEENEVILSYAQSIYNMDKEINRLYEYIKQYEEPTMLVFFGDHLPHLKTSAGADISSKFSIFNTDNDIQNILNKYSTECVILTNYKVENKKIDLLSQDYLGCYIINNMDLKISNYYKFLYQQINYIPASNRFITRLNNGEYIYTDKISSDVLEKNKLRKNIQYYMFN